MFLDKHKIRKHICLNESIGDGELESVDLLVSQDMDILDRIIKNEINYNLKEALDILTERQKQVIIIWME